MAKNIAEVILTIEFYNLFILSLNINIYLWKTITLTNDRNKYLSHWLLF